MYSLSNETNSVSFDIVSFNDEPNNAVQRALVKNGKAYS